MLKVEVRRNFSEQLIVAFNILAADQFVASGIVDVSDLLVQVLG